jgi:hypothetical protein
MHSLQSVYTFVCVMEQRRRCPLVGDPLIFVCITFLWWSSKGIPTCSDINFGLEAKCQADAIISVNISQPIGTLFVLHTQNTMHKTYSENSLQSCYETFVLLDDNCNYTRVNTLYFQPKVFVE